MGIPKAEWGYPLKYKIAVPDHVHEPIGLDPQFGERTVNELEAQASGTNFWSFRTLVDLQTQQVVAAIGDLAGNVGFATNTILLNLTTNAAYAYDMAGNVTNISYNAGEETVGLVWNSQYELTAVHTNGALAESYRYDPLGRRVRTITGTVTNYHLHNGIHALADLDATGAVLRAYTYGPGIDNLLAITTFSSTETNHYYYLTDHLGSVLAIADEDGEIVERYHYDAWGRVTITDAVGFPLTESAIGNRFGFQGREHSWATGLIHFRARWYDPITGRWLSNDPIGIAGGLNQYVAFRNSPTRYLDPLGLDDWDVVESADRSWDRRAANVQQVGAAVGNAAFNGSALVVEVGPLGDAALVSTGEDSWGRANKVWAIAPFASKLLGKVGRWFKGLFRSECVVRSFDDLGSLRGADPNDVLKLIPPGWESRPLRDLNGVRYFNPARRGEVISFNLGYKGASDPIHAGPYLKVSRDGEITRIPLKGNPALQ